MATSSKINAAAIQQAVLGQFRGLNPNDPPSWPLVPRIALCLALMAMIVVGLWFAWLSSSDEELEAERAKEVTLRADYQKKLAQAVNLEALKKQREQVLQYVTQLEKQLPSKAEMDALLSDINQAGLGRSLNFDVGAFAADIANLSRIVTLNNIGVVPGKDGTLVMDATAKTFRYLDKDEVDSQRKAAPGAKKK